jgi:hypothetical protein
VAHANIDGSVVSIETDLLCAQVFTEGYVSGIGAGSLLDKRTGARDLGFGLDIVDFLLEPRSDEPGVPEEHAYALEVATHGHIPKRYVELPQICTQARRLQYGIVAGPGFVAVKQWHRWSEATYERQPGSLWEQMLLFQDGLRYVVCADTVTSVNDVEQLILRIDMPGHLKHTAGDSFEQVYLSYEGLIPAPEFCSDAPPDATHLYQRPIGPIPERFIRAYQVKLDDRPGPWLAGITLDPQAVWEAWCHQRGYVCFIEEIGGCAVRAGDSFGAAYAVGWFDDIAAMEAVADEHRGARGIDVAGAAWQLRE